MKKQDLFAIFIIVIFYAVLYFFGAGCPIKAVTGISCAGCGMTRAWLSLFSGNWTGAFFYHPLFWMVPIALVLFLFRQRIPRKILHFFAWVGGITFLIVYILRLIDPTDNVVIFSPDEGLLFHLLLF